MKFLRFFVLNIMSSNWNCMLRGESDIKSGLKFRMLTASNNTYHHNMCPVTSLFDFKTDGYFKYPVDLFEPHLHKVLLTQLHHKTGSKDTQSKLYNCTSERNDRGMDGVDQFPHPKHVCTDGVERKCPVSPDYLTVAFQKSSQWLYPNESTIPFLYHIWEAMMDRDAVIRVIVLGGSAARGSEAAGCYCNPILDTKCQAFNHKSFRKSRSFSMHIDKEDCRWSTFFVKWLRTISDATIKDIYLTEGGALPSNGEIFIQDFFRPGQQGSLTRRDILIFDYSMNEAQTFRGTPQGKYEQHVILERAVRTAFTMTDENEKVPPTIILTETFGEPCNPRDCGLNKTSAYADVYSEIARYYNLPIFSYLDVLHSSQLQRDRAALKALTIKGSHPLWYIHQFYADLFASLFANELRRCFDFALQHGTEEVPQRLNAMPLLNQTILSPMLPEVDDEVMCDKAVKPLLDIAAADFLAKDNSNHRVSRQNNPAIGWYSVLNASTWDLVEERGEKYGWIDEFKGSYGSIERGPQTLRFYMTDPEGKLFTDEHLLMIRFLRTYKNAGQIRLKFCGQLISDVYPGGTWKRFKGSNTAATIDALWPNYEVNKISIPEYAIPYITGEGVDSNQCFAAFKDNPNVLVIGVNSNQQKTEQHLNLNLSNSNSSAYPPFPFLDIIHEPACYRIEDHAECLSRDITEKFKIISIKICKRRQ